MSKIESTKLYALDTIVYFHENPHDSKEYDIKACMRMIKSYIEQQDIFGIVNQDNYEKYDFIKTKKEGYYYIPTYLLPFVPEGSEIFDSERDITFIKKDTTKLEVKSPYSFRYSMKLPKGDK